VAIDAEDVHADVDLPSARTAGLEDLAGLALSVTHRCR
jgi:hypothetical protein